MDAIRYGLSYPTRLGRRAILRWQGLASREDLQLNLAKQEGMGLIAFASSRYGISLVIMVGASVYLGVA